MKTRLGKVTFWLIIVLLAIGLTWTITQKAQARTTLAQTFVLPSSPSVTYDTATYILLWDQATGNFVTQATGVVAAGVTWANADIATAAHATNTEVWTATIPPLNTEIKYGMTIWSGANNSNADTFQAGPFIYDPILNMVFSDTNPIRGNHVKTGS